MDTTMDFKGVLYAVVRLDGAMESTERFNQFTWDYNLIQLKNGWCYHLLSFLSSRG